MAKLRALSNGRISNQPLRRDYLIEETLVWNCSIYKRVSFGSLVGIPAIR